MSDPGGEKKGNFWTTLPGMLTGLAALITAISGLLTVILHLSSPSSKPPDSVTEPSHQTSKSTQTPTSETTSMSVTGNWEWEGVGAATLQQNGNEVAGLLHYYKPPGLTASLQGTFNERELAFVWWFTQGPSSLQNPQGDGTLTLSADGRTLNGTFTDRARGAVRYPWILKRVSP